MKVTLLSATALLAGCLPLINRPDFDVTILNGTSDVVAVGSESDDTEFVELEPHDSVTFDDAISLPIVIKSGDKTLAYDCRLPWDDFENSEEWTWSYSGSVWCWLSPDLKLYAIPMRRNHLEDHESETVMKVMRERQPRGYPIEGVER